MALTAILATAKQLPPRQGQLMLREEDPPEQKDNDHASVSAIYYICPMTGGAGLSAAGICEWANV